MTKIRHDEHLEFDAIARKDTQANWHEVKAPVQTVMFKQSRGFLQLLSHSADNAAREVQEKFDADEKAASKIVCLRPESDM